MQLHMAHPVATGGDNLRVTSAVCTNVLNLCQSSVMTQLSTYQTGYHINALYPPANQPVPAHHITSKIVKVIVAPNRVRLNNEYFTATVV